MSTTRAASTAQTRGERATRRETARTREATSAQTRRETAPTRSSRPGSTLIPKFAQFKQLIRNDLGEELSNLLDEDDCVLKDLQTMTKKQFQGTNRSSFFTYEYKGKDLDKIQQAAMVLLYTKYNNLFEDEKTFITLKFLEKIKKDYADEKNCPVKKFHPVLCVQRFLKAFSTKLEINVVAFPLIAPKELMKNGNGNPFQPFKLTNSDKFKLVSIYFDYGEEKENITGEDDYQGALTIIGTVNTKTLDKILKGAEYEWAETPEMLAAKETPQSSKSAEEQSKVGPDESSSSNDKSRAPASPSSNDKSRAPASPSAEDKSRAPASPSAENKSRAVEPDSSSSESSRSESSSPEAVQPSRSTTKRSNPIASRTVRVSFEKKDKPKEITWPTNAPKAEVLAEIINGSYEEKKIKQYTKTFNGKSLLTEKQSGIAPYTVKNAQQRYDEAKSRNIFPSIIPVYMEKCNLTMKRNGLQVIYITPHISRIISILGFKGPIKAETFEKIKTFANSEQLRSAVQFRNLLSQINIGKNYKHQLVGKDGRYTWMSADTICNLGGYPLDVFSFPYEPQTILLGVQRTTSKTEDPELKTLDRITSMFTYKPSSLYEDAKRGRNEVTGMDETPMKELTELWRSKKLAYFDIGCASSPKTENNLLANNDVHFRLLMCYAFLNILKETNKGGRKYQGICVKLVAQTVYKTATISQKLAKETAKEERKGDEKQQKYKKFLLEGLLKNFHFQECTIKMDESDDPKTCKYFALYGDDKKFIDLIEAIDKKLDEHTSPYMQEVCKAGVCK